MTVHYPDRDEVIRAFAAAASPAVTFAIITT
jgi:hypothetical protein